MLEDEALAMGLDRDDSVVRRRMAQKLEFLSQDLVDENPSESELRGFFEEDSERFAEPVRLSFRHVYLNPDRRGDALKIYAELFEGGPEEDSRRLGRSDDRGDGDGLEVGREPQVVEPNVVQMLSLTTIGIPLSGPRGAAAAAARRASSSACTTALTCVSQVAAASCQPASTASRGASAPSRTRAASAPADSCQTAVTG